MKTVVLDSVKPVQVYKHVFHVDCRGGNNDKGFGFALNAWFIVALCDTSYLGGVSY